MTVTIPTRHLGRNPATQYAASMLKVIGIAQPDKFLSGATICYRDRKPFSIDDEIMSLMAKGRANHLQRIHDDNDEYFAPALSIGVGSIPAGIRITTTSSLGDVHEQFHQEGIAEDVGESLANDIEFHRTETATAITNENMPQMARSYRCYLNACISMLDYFLHRHEQRAFRNGPVGEPIETPNRLPDRIQAWIETYSPTNAESLLSSQELSTFKDLLRARNKYVHPKQPIFNFQATEVLRVLNLSAQGVGGLLGLLRVKQGLSPYLGFINQISTLKKIQKT